MVNKQLVGRKYTGLEIAVIGMSARCPGADDVEQFWENLKEGRECITFLDAQELIKSGISQETLEDPNYVKACAELKDSDKFDAQFFGYTPREAEIMDPQQRIFLETCWKVMEDAGYTKDYKGLVGIYGSSGLNTYLLSNMAANIGTAFDPLQAEIGNDKDYLTTRVSYKMNLKGPSFAVQSACSSSLVAVHIACRALLSGECDMALAGGVSVKVPLREGYYYQNGGVQSPDGHCRAFDEDAMGSIFGSGVGVVVLKPLTEAIADRDHIYAVIKGSAINNDGDEKVGYTASSVNRQSEVIQNAHVMAEVKPSSIQYIETHGTGTKLGDPVEMRALIKAFAGVEEEFTCAVGSVKTNVGHLITAAGIISLIKTVLCLQNKTLVPSLNFHKANSNINFEESCFYVNTETKEWHTNGGVRRAGVSSFGIGGTNVHLIIEEAPEIPEHKRERQNVIPLSAKSEEALKTMCQNLEQHINKNKDIDLSDMAYTLQSGRESFKYRASLTGKNREELMSGLEDLAAHRNFTESKETNFPAIVFMFPGQGSQYTRMGAELYKENAVFRKTVNECIDILNPLLDENLYEILFADLNDVQAPEKMRQTAISQALLFTIEYALAKLWTSLGIKADIMIGHSLGEYVAACLAGVFSLQDALQIIAVRGKLLQSLPTGTMISLEATKEEIKPYLGNGISVAAENSEFHYVLSGSQEAMLHCEKQLARDGRKYNILKTSHGFHSEMVEPIMDQFQQELEKYNRKPPVLPYLSNVTGAYIKAEEAVSSKYWLKHLRNTVRFSTSIKNILKDGDSYIFLEVGPGKTLGNLLLRNLAEDHTNEILHSLPTFNSYVASDVQIMRTLGKLWEKGAFVDWKAYSQEQNFYRISLPTYPFARTRFWLEGSWHTNQGVLSEKKGNQVYVPKWIEQPSRFEADSEELQKTHLIFMNDQKRSIEIGTAAAEELKSAIQVYTGDYFYKENEHCYRINPKLQRDYHTLIEEVLKDGYAIERIIHLLSIYDDELRIEQYGKYTVLSFHSLLYLAQAISGKGKSAEQILFKIVVQNMEQIGSEQIEPLQSLVKGPCKVIPVEMKNIVCCGIDVQKDTPIADVMTILFEKQDPKERGFEVYRDHKKFIQEFQAIDLTSHKDDTLIFKDYGVYLITGGLGGLGLLFSEHIAKKVKHPKLILTGRSGVLKGNKSKVLRALEASGAEITILKVDVTDEPQMRLEIARIYDKYETIHGVIHAAGIAGGGIVAMKDYDKAEAVISPKVKGAMVLESVLKNQRLDFFVLCSSTIAMLGGIGQVDYCAANACLDSFAHYYRKKYEVLVVSVNWDEWIDTGMSKQTAITDDKVILSHPIFNYYEKSQEKATFTAELSAATSWLLSEHKISGRPALPGTAYIDAVRSAFRELCGYSGIVEINDLAFQKTLIPENDTARFEIQFISDSEEQAKFIATALKIPEDLDPLVSGTIRKYNGVRSNQYDYKQVIAAGNMKEVKIEPSDGQDGMVFWGRRWKHNLRSVYTGENCALAYLQLPQEFYGDLKEYEIHPALFDVATGFAVQHYSQEQDYLPFMYKKIIINGPLESSFYSYIKLNNYSDRKKDILSFDIIFFSENKKELVAIEDFTLVKVKKNV